MHIKGEDLPISDVDRGRLAESLAYWFLRLNGFLTIENFIIHPDADADHNGARTDADIVGVRFPFRDEQGLLDFPFFAQLDAPIFLAVEVFAGETCKINGAWSEPERNNVGRLLAAMGVVPKGELGGATQMMYEQCHYASRTAPHFFLQYAATGFERSAALTERFPSLLQLTWKEILVFIHRRFAQHRRQKEDHKQWRSDGLRLWENSERGEERFVASYLNLLRTGNEHVC